MRQSGCDSDKDLDKRDSDPYLLGIHPIAQPHWQLELPMGSETLYGFTSSHWDNRAYGHQAVRVVFLCFLPQQVSQRAEVGFAHHLGGFLSTLAHNYCQIPTVDRAVCMGSQTRIRL